MIPLELLHTALLLGCIVLLSGCYGVLYGIGRLSQRRSMTLMGFACYGLQIGIAVLIAATAPLPGSWKLVVLVCSLGFLGIPPITWRFLELSHETRRHS